MVGVFLKSILTISLPVTCYVGHNTDLQSFAKYLRQTLVFMWNSEIRESFDFYFSAVSFDNFLSFKSFGNSWGNSYIACLLQIIVLRFSCSEKKIGKT